MSLNGKSKTLKSKSPDYMNILYTDSDSDSIPDLKLPPVKGKKHRKRKGASERSGDTCCSFWTVLKLIIGVVLLIVWIMLAAVSFWSLRQIGQLRERMSAVESSDKASTELLKFQSQLAEVNTSVVAIKNGHGGLQEIANALAQVQKQVKAFETANKELQASVSASKDLLSLPNKLDALSNTIASLGSDISRLGKDTQTLQDGHFESRIAALENSMKEKNQAPRITADSPETVNFNETIHSGLQSLRQELSQFSARISVLEKFTSETPARVTEQVAKLLQEKMGSTAVGDPGASNSSEPSQVLAGVLLTDKGEFLTFKADILDNFEKVNETVVILNQELDTIAARLDRQDQALINLTSAVLRVSQSGAGRTPEAAGANAAGSSTTVSTPTSSSAQESTTGAGTAGPGIHIEGISSLEDLQKAFNNSWPLENGQVNMDLLEAVASPDTRLQLRKFDFDGNGLMSEEELAIALGFHHNPRLYHALLMNERWVIGRAECKTDLRVQFVTL